MFLRGERVSASARPRDAVEFLERHYVRREDGECGGGRPVKVPTAAVNGAGGPMKRGCFVVVLAYLQRGGATSERNGFELCGGEGRERENIRGQNCLIELQATKDCYKKQKRRQIPVTQVSAFSGLQVR